MGMLAARAADAGELFQTHIGGSAVLEGVMMRGRCGWAVSVRTDAGGMYVEERVLPDAAERPAWQKLPIVRGCVSFVESMCISYEALSIAVDHVYDEAPGGAAEAGAAPSAPGGEMGTPCAVQGTAEVSREARTSRQVPPADAPDAPAETPAASADAGMFASVAVGVLLGVGLFVALPVAVTNLLMGDLQAHNSLAWNLVEAAFRLVVLVAYIWGVGRLPDMARVFAYHGAEHQAIHCYEHGLDLTPENCMRFSRLHVRCGTAFIVMTVIIAVAVNAVVPVGALANALGATGIARWLVVFASRLVLLPLVMGISYEITVRWAGRHPDNPLVRVVLWPGVQMQRLTTRVPDRGMLECAISSLVRVRAQEVRAERARM
ncbi:DUF1385 domain-containing protein [[Collinsella] massiliensis]|uniref:Metal-dependent enzyme n=1 Tax=[Collinsella] massiliensis TaxID=1232426 RepID=A0A1Y3XTY0_9ACTN|nr:DUF1385 domain-containing protein [[Collinsella] massiliensis]OUN86589.1 metal-dependent enzyme [[Collinsella] massiliensis]